MRRFFSKVCKTYSISRLVISTNAKQECQNTLTFSGMSKHTDILIALRILVLLSRSNGYPITIDWLSPPSPHSIYPLWVIFSFTKVSELILKFIHVHRLFMQELRFIWKCQTVFFDTSHLSICFCCFNHQQSQQHSQKENVKKYDFLH